MATSKPPIEPAGWVRLAVVSIATAAGLAGLLAGAAFSLQAVTLPRPTGGQLIAAQTLRWLTRQKAVKSTAHFPGRTVSSVCVNAMVGPLGDNRHRLRGSLLITGRKRFVETRLASFRLGPSTLHEEDGRQAEIRASVAGCPRALERRIGRFLDDRAPVGVKKVALRGWPVLRLSFHHGTTNLFVIVNRRTYAPAAFRIPRAGLGWTYLAPAKPRDLSRPELRLSWRLRLVLKEEA